MTYTEELFQGNYQKRQAPKVSVAKATEKIENKTVFDFSILLKPATLFGLTYLFQT